MKAEIKALHSPDVYDLVNYSPEKEDNFCFLLQVLAGLKDEEGEESFDIVVCTPKWLMENHNRKDVVFGRHRIIVFEYDYQRLLTSLKTYIESFNESNWIELGEKIGRIGKWEFEDYCPQTM